MAVATRRRTAADGLTTTTKSTNKNAHETSSNRATARYGLPTQILRGLLFTIYFLGSCLSIHTAQLLGSPLYFIDRETYYAYMAVTKQYFALLMTTATQWSSPTLVRISGDASVRGQLKQTRDGRFEAEFPERLVLIANHQLYTDWLYLWWVAYTATMHGHVYIILKQSLKWIPIIGPGMQFYSFIFLARKWTSDQTRMAYRLRKLQIKKTLGSQTYLDPMWLLIFPEGTNLSAKTRASSQRWAEKSGQQDCEHTLLPRATGLQFCLDELSDSVEYVYDCTIAYEHIPPGQFGQDIFTLRTVCIEGRPPKSVNMHWRRFKVTDIPLKDRKAMDEWVLARWREKDELLGYYLRNGRFPADVTAISDRGIKVEDGYIETEVKPRSPFEFLQMYVPVVLIWLFAGILVKMWNLVTTGRLGGLPK